MAGYDWGRGYGPDRGYGRPRDAYGSDFGSRGGAWGSAWGRGFRGPDRGLYRQWGSPAEGWGYTAGRGYDRGIYGGDHPAYGGYPGEQSGMYYGGRGGYGSDPDRWVGRQWSRGASGYDRPMMGSGGGYGPDSGGGFAGGYGSGRGGPDSGFAGAPFVPEEAYRRHPELSRHRDHFGGGWPDHGHDPVGAGGEGMEDGELGQAVKQNLHQDTWIHPDRIDVNVRDGVVTLTGEVDDYMEARYAWDDAWETAGVRGVINHLTVRTDEPHETHGDVVPQTSGKKKK